MSSKIIKAYQYKIQHFNPDKYWSRREKVINPKYRKIKLRKLFYLRYLKKCETFNCAYICTNINGGAVFKSRPNLPHGLNGIVVGNNVIIGKNCTIMHRVTIAEGTKDKPTILGDNVFIGTGAVIRSGRVIGSNVRVGANAVVTHDVPPYCLVAGVPATVKKQYSVSDGYYDEIL